MSLHSYESFKRILLHMIAICFCISLHTHFVFNKYGHRTHLKLTSVLYSVYYQARYRVSWHIFTFRTPIVVRVLGPRATRWLYTDSAKPRAWLSCFGTLAKRCYPHSFLTPALFIPRCFCTIHTNAPSCLLYCCPYLTTSMNDLRSFFMDWFKS